MYVLTVKGKEDDGAYSVANETGEHVLYLFQEEDGCVNSTNAFEDRYNITEAFLPAYAHVRYKESTIHRGDMFAKGVGDIRIDLSDLNMENFAQFPPCNDNNSEVCNLPLKHEGDLRAQWTSQCFKTVGKGSKKILYKTSWGFHFANPNPAQECDNYPVAPYPQINRPYEDPVAVLTAAEWLPEKTKTTKTGGP